MLKKNTKLNQNILCGSRVMSIFTKRPQTAQMMFGEATSQVVYQRLDNHKINKYTKFDQNIPCGSNVKCIFCNCLRLVGPMLSKTLAIKKGCNGYQWLDNVDIHMYAQI